MRKGSKTASEPATESASSWSAWRGPAIFIPLAGVVLLPAAALLLSLFDKQQPAPAPQVTEISALSEPAPVAPAASSASNADVAPESPAPKQTPAPAKAKPPAPAPRAQMAPGDVTAGQHATVNQITVTDSPGAVTGAIVTVNSIDIGPEQ